jgi:solute carrier family 8 (sodium/calcium exchanger)
MAKAGKDFDAIDTIIEFKGSETLKFAEIIIKDDDNWEPDRDFYVKLYDCKDGIELSGKDTSTRITIIDDDKPGYIAFDSSAKTGILKVTADDEDGAEIKLIRKNGSDGKVTVRWETQDIGEGDEFAKPGIDYEAVKSGVIIFEDKETEASIRVKILEREGERNESFGIKLLSVEPEAAKLSKKDFIMVNIVTDAEAKKRQEFYASLIKKLQDEEEVSWGQQFINACKLHPTWDEGELQEVNGYEAFIHFSHIGWKVFYALIPPPHLYGGFPCFVIALVFIGITTALVENFATVFGCVLGIKPSVTAITFVALGTSLPDTFASMSAAQGEKYADDAIGNVTGSNSVNVFLGQGIPWMIGAIYTATSATGAEKGYYQNAGPLGFSVVVFLVCATICIITLLLRRFVFVGAELGGSPNGRTASMTWLILLWVTYIALCTCQAYEIGGLEKIKFGIVQPYFPKIKKECEPVKTT